MRMMHPAAGRAWKSWLLLLGLAFLCLAGAQRPAEAQLGGELFATGGPATVTVEPSTAGYTSELWLQNPNPADPDIFLATNRDEGLTVPLPTFPAGTPLVFYIYVRNTDDTFYMGDGSNNPDQIPHAVVTPLGAGEALVGFEDLFGGGDFDYDDNVFHFTGVIPDITPPTISGCSLSQDTLWSPNHKMVDITVNYTVSDNTDAPGDITCVLSATSNEPDSGLGDGDTANDIQIVDAHHIRLRAERSGKGSGRVYTITITCTDTSGNVSTQTCTVSVPHDRRK